MLHLNQEKNMKLVILIPIWIYFSCILSSSANDTTRLLEHVLGNDKDPILHTSSDMQAHSPGVPEVRIVHVHHQDLNKRILIALVAASSLLGGILLFLFCFWIYRARKLKKWKTESHETSVADTTKGLAASRILKSLTSFKNGGKKGSVAVIEYQLLVAATNNFNEDNILGEGGLGCVYKAHFNDKFQAAVKRLNGGGQDVRREFQNEVALLSKMRHQNVVSLIGYCIGHEIRFLVYELMQNGSLESLLHGHSRGANLTWHLRMKIALDVSRGLEYLHEHWNPPVIHRDLKSSNILLDSNLNAKISDFGLAITAGSQGKTNLRVSGTLGYLAPEYILDGKLTDKSDVYAFGVILLELLTGRRPVEKVAEAQSQSIVSWAMPQLTDRSKLPNIVDPAISYTMDLKHLYQVAAVALLCVQPEPSYRPLITDVLHSLIPLVPVELGGSLRVSETRPLTSG